jgi:hypothetical protein
MGIYQDMWVVLQCFLLLSATQQHKSRSPVKSSGLFLCSMDTVEHVMYLCWQGLAAGQVRVIRIWCGDSTPKIGKPMEYTTTVST